jgi:hypothetical protein
MRFLHRLLDAIARCKAYEIDEHVISLARRNFLRRAGATLALPAVVPLLADNLIELLQPAGTIFLPPAPQVWAVESLGGYFYSRGLAEVLTMQVEPLVRFRQLQKPTKFRVKPDRMTWNVYAG